MFNKKNSEYDLQLKMLENCYVFNGLSGHELRALLDISHIRDYGLEEKIFNEGTIGLCFYIIVSGSVKIVYEKEGTVYTLKEYKEGECFSEVHVFSETYHSVSCVAGEVTKLIVFSKPDFEDLVKIKPKTGNKILLKFLEFFGSKTDELYKENRELKHKLNS